MGGRIPSEWVAGFNRNGWPDSTGISGRIQPEWVAGFNRNGWPVCAGNTQFRTAHELEAYLGVIPSERSSGEKRQLGHITKAGNGRMRWLLVEAAWQILRSKSPQTLALRTWTVQIAHRRGKRIAVVALARRLAGILYAMWRDGVAYDAHRIRPLPPAAYQRAG